MDDIREATCAVRPERPGLPHGPHFPPRLAHLPRMPHLPTSITWSEWTRRLPHVDFHLPDAPLHWPAPTEIESWPVAFSERARESRRATRRRQWAAAVTVVALLGGFQLVDQAITRWSVGSTPSGHWAEEASHWSESMWAQSLAAESSTDRTPGVGTLTLDPGPTADDGTVPQAKPGLAPTAETANGASNGKRFVRVVVTGYSSSAAETDEDPHVTAWNTRPKAGTLALSRDLLRTFTPGAPFDFGDKILIPGVGVYRVEDTMSGRWRRRGDLWFASVGEARGWGQRAAYVSRIPDETPIIALRSEP